MKLKKSSSAKTNMKQYAKKNVNLLPQRYLQRKRRRYYTLLGVLVVVVLVALAGLEYYDTLNEVNQITSETDAVNREIQIRNSELNRINFLYSLRDAVESKVKILKDIQNTHASVTSIFRYIEESLPEGIVYLSIEFETENGIAISGRTKTKEEIPDFLHKIREMDRFAKVGIGTITKVEEGIVTGTKHGNAPIEKKFEYYEFVFQCELGGEEDESK